VECPIADLRAACPLNIQSLERCLSRRTGFVGLLLLMQTVCFAAGIWLQHFCIDWTTREAMWKRDVSSMAQQGSKLVPRISGSIPTNDLARIMESQSADDLTAGRGIILVDGSWNVVASTDRDALPTQSRAQLLRWRPGRTDIEVPVGAVVGSFALEDGRHFGVAQPLGDNRGFLVVHRSEAALEADISAFLSALVGVSVITLVWTAALMGICAYVLTGRFCDEVDRERSTAMIEALRQRQNLVRTRDAVIFGLAKLTESRDPETGNHLDRISMYSTTLATALMNHPDFKDVVNPSFVRLIGISAVLHDIGKVGVEDKILLKPGKLTASERSMMEDHSRIGGECLSEIERRLGRSNFLHMARDIAFSHHERWDGSGYPHGLRGEQIPLAARIVAIADAYDALSSRRIYKEPQLHDLCVSTIREGSRTYFDPRIVETWLTVAGRFREISDRCSDPRTQVFNEREDTMGEGIPERDYRTLAPAGSPGPNFKDTA
jgi:response regulator RpfG family c-di-GMP phosphodiesterase